MLGRVLKYTESPLAKVVAAAVASRVLVLLWSIAVANFGVGSLHSAQQYDSGQWHTRLTDDSPRLSTAARLLYHLTNWDGHYFMSIPHVGYKFEQWTAFYPGWPALVRATCRVASWAKGRSSSTSSAAPSLEIDPSCAVLTSVLLNMRLFVIAATLLYHLTLRVWSSAAGDLTTTGTGGEAVAQRAALLSALLFCINPAGIFFSASYSEPLFTVCSLAACLSLEHAVDACVRPPSSTHAGPGVGSWAGRTLRAYAYLLLGALAAAAAGLTRSNGVLLCVWVLYAGARMRGRDLEAGTGTGPAAAAQRIVVWLAHWAFTCAAALLPLLPTALFQTFGWAHLCPLPLPLHLQEGRGGGGGHPGGVRYPAQLCSGGQEGSGTELGAALPSWPMLLAWWSSSGGEGGGPSRLWLWWSCKATQVMSHLLPVPVPVHVLRGTGPEGGRPVAAAWCGHRTVPHLLPFPPLYGYVQATYWGVHPWAYWELKQAPQFLLAAPVLLLCAWTISTVVRRGDRGRMAGWFERLLAALLPPAFPLPLWPAQPQHSTEASDSGDGSRRTVSPVTLLASPCMLPYTLHWALLCAVGCVAMYVQVSVRVSAAACPVMYWAAAALWMAAEQQEGKDTGTDAAGDAGLQGSPRVSASPSPSPIRSPPAIVQVELGPGESKGAAGDAAVAAAGSGSGGSTRRRRRRGSTASAPRLPSPIGGSASTGGDAEGAEEAGGWPARAHALQHKRSSRWGPCGRVAALLDARALILATCLAYTALGTALFSLHYNWT